MATDTGVGRRLRELREAAGYSQQALADLVNEQQGSTWQQATVWKIENDRRPLTLGDVEALAHVFHMSLEEMLYGQDDWDSTSDLPISDPAHDLHRRALTGRATALHFEIQALTARINEARAELARVLDERDGTPDFYDGEGRK